MWLTKREEEILKHLVEIYIQKGQPVSSRAISKAMKETLSSATIRNEMMNLEEKGYIYQPHSQAGRLPREKAIRYYLKNLVDESYRVKIKNSLKKYKFMEDDFSKVWENVSIMLSDLTQGLGFVVVPNIFKINFISIRFIKMGANRIVLIMETVFGALLTKVFTSTYSFSQRELDLFSEEITKQYKGKTIDYAMKSIYGSVSQKKKTILKIISELKKYIIQNEKDSNLFIKGEEKLIESGLKKEIEKLEELVKFLEDKEKLLKLLKESKTEKGDVNIVFSPEVEGKHLDVAMLSIGYDFSSEVNSSLGVIGPKNINYPASYYLLKELSENLTKIFFPTSSNRR